MGPIAVALGNVPQVEALLQDMVSVLNGVLIWDYDEV